MNHMMQLAICILALHYVGDFVMQSDWMAQNKSRNWGALAIHVGVYTTTFLVIALLCGVLSTVLVYVLLNGGIHFVVDAITSRISSKCYRNGDMHTFWCVVGFDQLLHQACLLSTAYWLLR